MELESPYVPLLALNRLTEDQEEHQTTRVFDLPRVIKSKGHGGHIDRNTLQFHPETLLELLTLSISDRKTLEHIRLGELHQSLNHTSTQLGTATLYRSLAAPPTSLSLIHAKQQALDELRSNRQLGQTIDDCLGHIAHHEEVFFRYMNFMGNMMSGHQDFKSVRRLLKPLHELVEAPETPYLAQLVSGVQQGLGSRTIRLFNEPLYRTFRGLRLSEERSQIEPFWYFRPNMMSLPAYLAMTSFAAAPEFIAQWGALHPMAIPLLAAAGVGSFIYATGFKKMVDHMTAITPMQRQLLRNPESLKLFDAIGKLDELRSLEAYRKDMSTSMTTPKMTESEHHYFKAKGMRSPLNADIEFVPNEVDISGHKQTYITGPNSGGKTSYCQTIQQFHLLGQIGSDVPATSSEMSVTPQLGYQGPEFLQGNEGNFGSNMIRTSELFYQSSPRSLNVLDELAEGTTTEEKSFVAEDVLTDWAQIQGTTVLVTHNHELVDSLVNQGYGRPLQVEIVGGEPTHKLIEGISTRSYAERVMDNIEFGPSHRRAYLDSLRQK